MNTVLNMGAQILTSGTVLYFGVLMDWFEEVSKQQTMTIVCLEIIVIYYFIAMVLGMILEPKWKKENAELEITRSQKESLGQMSIGTTEEPDRLSDYDGNGDGVPRKHFGSE